ncbi:transporter [Geobacter sp. DSM 9736]|uniref:transporter n=1 Tax=Geobacter sp. DSM 9736 TaxID=1277350 RepID=UPI000B4FEC4A|nr:transporter [Geobacter sp. DSM 9736]SNB45707.1 Putative MetA-pathway of phenol degradation [Geobacter sp. DSM 9736]
MITQILRPLALSIFISVTLLPFKRAHGEILPFLGLGFEFTSGDYGTGTRTNTVFVPVTIGADLTDRWGVLLEIPYIYQDNTNVIGRQYNQMQMQTTRMKTAAAMVPGSGSMGRTASSNPSAGRGGLGDLTLRIGYVAIEETRALPRIKPVASVKLPTADKDHGLGTGKFEESLSVEFSKWMGDWYGFIEPGYTFQGSSPALALKDYPFLDAGIGYQLTNRFRPLLIVKSSGAPQEGATALLDARIKGKYQTTAQTGIEAYGAKGITTSSPDYAVGLTIYYDF